jgi:hypothetical protein
MAQRTKTQLQALIEQQRTSGKIIKTICQEHGLSEGYFYSVKSKLKAAKSTPSRFLTLKSAEQKYSPALIIHHKNVQLSIPATISPDWIAELIKRLNP